MYKAFTTGSPQPCTQQAHQFNRWCFVGKVTLWLSHQWLAVPCIIVYVINWIKNVFSESWGYIPYTWLRLYDGQNGDMLLCNIASVFKRNLKDCWWFCNRRKWYIRNSGLFHNIPLLFPTECCFAENVQSLRTWKFVSIQNKRWKALAFVAKIQTSRLGDHYVSSYWLSSWSKEVQSTEGEPH